MHALALLPVTDGLKGRGVGPQAGKEPRHQPDEEEVTMRRPSFSRELAGKRMKINEELQKEIRIREGAERMLA